MRTTSSRVLLAVLLVAAIVGNLVSRSLFFGVDFLFGSIAVLMVVRLYGLRWGIPVAIASSLNTYALWNHPWAIVIFTVEAAFVGAFLHRKHDNILLLDGLYWLFVGMPLVLLFYGGVMDVPTTSVTLIALKQSLNGILNALIASLLLMSTVVRRWAGVHSKGALPLSLVLFNLLVSLALFPAVLLTVADGHKDQNRVEANIKSQLSLATRSIGHRLSGWKNNHLRAVGAAADIATAIDPSNRDRLQRTLASIHRAFPDFHNMYVANERGITVAFDPPRNEWGQSTLGLDFSDRPYYARLRTTRQPVLSDVFTGRGGVREPIVTVSVPILRNGQFDGFALGALDLSATQSLLRDAIGAEALRATLVDRDNRVIASTNPDLQPLSPFSHGARGTYKRLNADTLQWKPNMTGAPAVVVWENSFYVQRFDNHIAPWQLIVEAPVRPYTQTLQRQYSYRLGVLLALAFGTLVLAFVLTRALTNPLVQLAAVTTNLPEKLLSGDRMPWPATPVAELALLVQNYKAMLASLNKHFRALGMSETRFRTVVEQSPIGILIFTPDGTCLQANQAWDSLWQPDVLSCGGTNLFTDSRWATLGIEPDIQRAIQGEAVTLKPIQINPPDGERLRWIEAFLYPVADEGGKAREIVFMAQDVTERRQAEEERARLLALERRARGEAEHLYQEAQTAARQKDDFLAMLAHELRNPLSAVSNALFVLTSVPPDAEAWGRALTILQRQVHHQTRLVDDLLDVSRITRGKVALHPAMQDLTCLIRNAVDDYREFMGEAGIKLTATVERGPVWVNGDETRLNQVISNLLNNAQKFTSPGGQVTVHMETDQRAGRVIVRVADTGEGISPETLEHVFDPFMQGKRSLDRSEGGLGLGLALARGLVELHGGEITAESPGQGQGAVFTFWLPLAPAPAEVSDPVEAHVTDGEKRRILIIEDNVDAAETLRDMLVLSGHTVALAFNGKDGIAAAADFGPDVVLCDIGLPGMDGYEVAQTLRRQPNTADKLLVAITGYGREEDRQHAERAGFDLHLTKPVDFLRLNSMLTADRTVPPKA